MNLRPRAAITGIGMVTPVGLSAAETWAGLLAGKSGAGPVTTFDVSSFPTRIGAEVKGFSFDKIIDKKLAKFASRSTHFAISAAEEAFRDAGIRPDSTTGSTWALSAGAGMMSVSVKELEVVRQAAFFDDELHTERMVQPRFGADPVYFCRTQTNAALGVIAQYFGIQGHATAVHTACASGGQALGTALKLIRRGQAKRVLAGGYDSMLNPMGLASFCLLGAVSTDNDNPERASRPFDLTRNGFVLGEGAAFLVLEEWESAVERGAHIYAELAGDGNSLSSYRITDSPPDGNGPIQAIRQALKDGNLSVDEIDYVNAHGTSTQMNDRSECAALNVVLGDRVKEVWVSSTKSCMGHMIAAAGAAEAAVCALTIREGILPINANHREADANCNVRLVLNEPQKINVRAAVSNSLGFGGTNSSLTFRRPS